MSLVLIRVSIHYGAVLLLLSPFALFFTSHFLSRWPIRCNQVDFFLTCGPLIESLGIVSRVRVTIATLIIVVFVKCFETQNPRRCPPRLSVIAITKWLLLAILMILCLIVFCSYGSPWTSAVQQSDLLSVSCALVTTSAMMVKIN